MESLHESTTWQGVYRCVKFTIFRGSVFGGGTIWNYYIHLPAEQFPEDVRADFCLQPQPEKDRRFKGDHYRYSQSPWGDIWFHGGVTFYSDLQSHPSLPSVIKVGCDYSHDGDEQYNDPHMSPESFIADVHETIDDLLRSCPGLRCFDPSGEGSWVSITQVGAPK